MNQKLFGLLLSTGLISLSCQKNIIDQENSKNLQSNLSSENAAPSMHFDQHFDSQAVLKMHKVKITQSGLTEFFMVNNYKGGYSGLQHTPDSSGYDTPTSKILIASLWDTNTEQGIHAQASYVAPSTKSSRFGGEGDGAKTMNGYNWKMNSWYNIVNRSWYKDGKMYVATFIQDISSGNWFHTSTVNRIENDGFLGNYNNSFLENWVSDKPDMDGRFTRKAYFKDCWGLDANGNWLKPNSRNAYINNDPADIKRNGIYHNNFDAGYDANENAYYLAHGAGVTPSSAFGGTRYRIMPEQPNQGTSPSLGNITIQNLTATYNNDTFTINWNIPLNSNPQFSSKIEIINSSNSIVTTVSDTIPERRSLTIPQTLASGNYTVKVTVRDIFNKLSTSQTASVNVQSSGVISGAIYELKPASDLLKNLDVDYANSANGTNVSVYTDNNVSHQRWKITSLGNDYFRIEPSHTSNRSLDVYAGGSTSGTNVQIYENHNGTSQKWKITSVGNGYYKLQPECAPTLCLDVKASNNNVEITSDNNSNSQKWKLEFISK